MIVQLPNINLNNLYLHGIDLLANRAVTTLQRSNMYEILFECEYFNKILNLALKEIKKYTNDDFEVYIKNMWGYMQNEQQNEPIDFNKSLKDQLLIKSQYSFIHLVKSSKTIFYFKNQKEEVNLTQGDILIFKTENFLREEFDTEDRLALVGSIALIGDNIEPLKKALI